MQFLLLIAGDASFDGKRVASQSRLVQIAIVSSARGEIHE